MGKTKQKALSVTTKRLLQLKGRMTLKTFSGRCGILQATMHNYLHGRDMPSRTLAKTCKSTGCSSDWLLGLESNGSSGNDKITIASLKMHIEARIKEDERLLKDLGV